MISEGLWTIFGVIIGSSVTFLCQFFFMVRREKNQNRKLFVSKYNQISNHIFTIKSALKNLINYLDTDICNYTDDILNEEVNKSLVHFSMKSSIIWKELRFYILSFFYKFVSNKSLLILEKGIILITNFDYNYDSNESNNFRTFRNIHNDFQNNKKEINQALLVIDLLEKENDKLCKKLVKIKL